MSPNLLASKFAVKNFLSEKINLDIMTHFSKGLSYREIADKIGKKYSFVQSQCDFLNRHVMIARGRWNVDLQAVGITKTNTFYEYKEEIKNELTGYIINRFFLSYLSQILMGKMKYFAMFNFPEGVKNKIGSEISSWYYTFPHFTLPFLKNGQFDRMLEEYFEEEDNKSPFPPRGQKIQKPDLIDIYICRYIQLEREDTNLKEFTRRMEDEIGGLVDVTYSRIRRKFQTMIETNIIYHINPLYFAEVSYVSFFVITEYKRIFKFIKVLNRLNIISGVSYMKDGKHMLYIHCPYDTKNDIINFLCDLDKNSQIFSLIDLLVNRGIPYKYYLRKYEK